MMWALCPAESYRRTNRLKLHSFQLMRTMALAATHMLRPETSFRRLKQANGLPVFHNPRDSSTLAKMGDLIIAGIGTFLPLGPG